jgi:uncharacterized membrane protein YgcG
MRVVIRVAAVAVVVSVSLFAIMSGIAAAKDAKGSPAWCKAHPKSKLAACRKTGKGGSGSGGGGAPPTMTAAVSPNPLVETGQSEIHAIIQVETSPLLAGAVVTIDSAQLAAVCMGGSEITNLQGTSFVLDGDGNATAVISGSDCAPGRDLVEADLKAAPYYTALTTLVVNPPVVTPTGVTGFPVTDGSQAEVETGDTNASGDSDVYVVFYVETDPVYAEQPVEISSTQLQDRCLTFWAWQPGNGGGGSGASGSSASGSSGGGMATTTLDNDGNAVFLFEGMSCGAGGSLITAEVRAGTHPTYTTTYTVLPPVPTI